MNNTEEQNQSVAIEQGIFVREIIGVIWRRRVLIVVVTLAVALLGILYAFTHKPVYKMTSTIALGNYTSSIYTNPQGAAQVLLSDNLVNEVIKELDLDIPPRKYRAFKKNITVNIVKDTSFVQITVNNMDRELGKKIIEKMVENYTRASGKDYENHYSLISGQLAAVNKQLEEKEEQLALIKKMISNLEKNQSLDSVQKEIKVNNLYNDMKDADAQRIGLLDRYLSLQKEKNSIEPVRTINSVRIPQYPEPPSKTLIVIAAVLLGGMISLFVAFIWDYFSRNPLDVRSLQ